MFQLVSTDALCRTITVSEVSQHSQHLSTYRQLEQQARFRAILRLTTRSPLTLAHLLRKAPSKSEELLDFVRIYWSSSKIRR